MIRYFKDNSVIKQIEEDQEFLIKEDWVEIENPINEYGKPYPKHKNLNELEDGGASTYYKTDGSLTVDGKVPIDVAKIAEKEQLVVNAEARAYLVSTDWYVTRKMETGEAIPQEILDARVAARASVL